MTGIDASSNGGRGEGAEHQGLVARSLTLRLGRRLLFSDYSLTVAPGELVHLVGGNGAGKTTLLKLLAGLRTPDAGDIFFNGQSIADDPADYRARLVFLGHVNGVKPELTPRENLQVHAALAHTEGALVDAALERLDLASLASQPCRLLSSGQRQRVGLARLELLRGDIWLLDEPFTALDVAGRQHVEALMHRHATAGGCVLFTSHQSLEADAVRTVHLDQTMVSR